MIDKAMTNYKMLQQHVEHLNIFIGLLITAIFGSISWLDVEIASKIASTTITGIAGIITIIYTLKKMFPKKPKDERFKKHY